MEPILKFTVNNQRIYREDNFHVVAGSKNYLKASFEFKTPEWQGKTKTAVFHVDKPYSMVLVNDTCEVPWEFTAEPGIKYVSVFAGDLITANKAMVEVWESGFKEGETPEPPTPSAYEQFVSLVEEIGDKASKSASQAEQSAVSASDSSARAVAAADAAARSSEQASKSAQSASESETNAKSSEMAAQKAASEIVADRKQIQTNKSDIDELKSDINQISDKMDNLPQPDWNQIDNKPFGEQVLMKYVLDENYTDIYETAEVNGVIAYRIPNSSYIPMESVEGGTLSLLGESIILNQSSNTLMAIADDAYVIYDGIFAVIPSDNFDLSDRFDSGGYFEHAGVYVADLSALGIPIEYPLSIEITKTVQIDDKYLPDNPTVFTVTETSSGVVDKTNDEIAAAILHGDIVKLHSKNSNDKILSLYSYQNSSDGTILSPFLFTSTSIGSDLKISSTIEASVSNQKVKYTHDETLFNINSEVSELTNNMMTKPSTASVGQILTIAGIDESGSPTKLVAENITDLVDTTPIILSPTLDEFSSGIVTSYGFPDILTALQSGKPVYISFENAGLEGRSQIISYSRNETENGYEFTVLFGEDILKLLFTSQ